MSRNCLILDNSVLSAFASAGWFQNLAFWKSDYDLLTTTRIWQYEFSPYHDYEEPEWLSVVSVDTAKIENRTENIGEADWTLIRLCEKVESGTVVTNDKQLRATAEQRDLEKMWGTKLAIQTFQACGIQEPTFRGNLPKYVEDIPLPESVISELDTVQKL